MGGAHAVAGVHAEPALHRQLACVIDGHGVRRIRRWGLARWGRVAARRPTV